LTGGAYYNSPYDLEMMMALVRKRDPIPKKLFLEKTETVASTRKYAKCAIDFYWGQKIDYPEVEEHIVPVVMSRKQYDEYMKIDQKYRGQTITIRKDPKTKKEVEEVTQPMWVSNMRAEVNALFECPKCDWVIQKLKQGRQALVYSFFKKSGIDLLKKRCDAEGITYSEIVGSTPKKPTRNGKKKSVQEIVDRFNAGKVQVLFVTKAGVEGLDLKKTMDVIALEANFNPSTDGQLIARAARYKSHEGSEVKKVDVWFMVLRKPKIAETLEADYQPSIDDKLLELVKQKGEGQEETYKKFTAASIEHDQCAHHPQSAKQWAAVSPGKVQLAKDAKKAAAEAKKAAAAAKKAAAKKVPKTKKVGAKTKKAPKKKVIKK
jgi:superfamily II DNA/RNA helicase